MHADDGERNVLEFDFGVRAYPPVEPGGYRRIRWEERRNRKDTTAKSRAAAIAKATEIVDRLAHSTPTALARATGADLIALPAILLLQLTGVARTRAPRQRS